MAEESESESESDFERGQEGPGEKQWGIMAENFELQ